MPHPRQENNGDIIIAVIGNTDACQNNFISRAALQFQGYISDHPQMATRCSHPDNGRSYVFLNLPPLSGVSIGEDIPDNIRDIVAAASMWLNESYINRVKVSGFIILHNITTLSTFHPLRTLMYFKDLCGAKMFSEATTFLTTGWDIGDSIADDAEEQWKNYIKLYRYARFGDSHESAWRIIDDTIKMPLQGRGIPRGNLRIELGNITSNDRVILITGPSGSGKSTFLNTATLGTARAKVEHSLEPRLQPQKNRIVRFPHPPTMQSYVLVEVPGFDAKDENTKDNIVVWGKSLFKDVEIAGIIYMHSVSDTTIDRLKVDLFKASYGENAVPGVMVGTSMWNSGQGRASQEDRQNRLNEAWSESLNSSKVLAFDNTFKSACDIINAVAPPKEELGSGQIWEGVQQHFIQEIIEELGSLIEKYQKSLERLFSALLH